MFISRDAFETSAGDWRNLNLQLYAGTNPVGMVDSSGNSAYTDLAISMAVRGALYGIVAGAAYGWAQSYARGASAAVQLRSAGEYALYGGAIGFAAGLVSGAAAAYGAYGLVTYAATPLGFATSFASAFVSSHIAIGGIALSSINYTNAMRNGDEADKVMAKFDLGLALVGLFASQVQLAAPGFQSARIYRFGTNPGNEDGYNTALAAFKQALSQTSKRSLGRRIGFGYSAKDPSRIVPLVSSSNEPYVMEPSVAEVAEYMRGQGSQVPGRIHNVGNCVEYRVANGLAQQGVAPEDMQIFVFDKKTGAFWPKCPACDGFKTNR